ncbi:methionyl-tRNA formyltransferase, partial [Vibrio parahaemolyticus]
MNATYTVVVGDNGEKYLQVDTYGSTKRQEIGKKSQSVRFSPEAIE